MRARRLFSLPRGPSEEKDRLWRSIEETELALCSMLKQRRVPTERLEIAAHLREAYVATRKLEWYLRRCADRGVRPLVVGEAPGKAEGPSGARLAAMLGVERLGDLADVANLLTDEEVALAGGTASGTASGAPVELLRARAEALPTKRRVVIACGRAVGAAFGIGEDVPFLAWRWRLRAAVLLLPHPSGRNRWWNDEEDRARAERSIAWIGRRLRDALDHGGLVVT